MKEDIVFVDDSVSNSDLVLSLAKSDKANIEWEEFQYKSEKKNDQLVNFELGLDLVNDGGKKTGRFCFDERRHPCLLMTLSVILISALLDIVRRFLAVMCTHLLLLLNQEGVM